MLRGQKVLGHCSMVSSKHRILLQEWLLRVVAVKNQIWPCLHLTKVVNKSWAIKQRQTSRAKVDIRVYPTLAKLAGHNKNT